MTYYDTAYLAKCYLAEPGAAIVRAHAMAQDAIACCETGRVELAAVLHRHHREGRLNASEYAVVCQQYDADLSAGLWTWLPITHRLLESTAFSFQTLSPSCFLRAADALHIACAKAHGFSELFTNDRHLLAACPTLGMLGRDLLNPAA